MNKFVKKSQNLEDFKQQANLKTYFETAYGYACFENVEKIGLVIGRARVLVMYIFGQQI
jgi:hypothetical protein